MPPEALGAAHAECWRAVGEVVELEVAEGHLNAHGGPPVLIRGSIHVVTRGDQGSVDVEGNGRSPPR